MNSREYDDIDLQDSQRVNFDFKGYLFKALSLWKIVFLSIGIALLIAYFINVRKESIYRLDSLITIDNDQNPFFTANTSISFNWGGVSGKVGSILTEIKTRTHNELVIDSLEYYKQYLKQGKYHFIDIYKSAPFNVDIIKSKPQILGKNLAIKFIDNKTYELTCEFDLPTAKGQLFDSKELVDINLKPENFSKIYSFGETVKTPFFNGIINIKPNALIGGNDIYYFKLNLTMRYFSCAIFKCRNCLIKRSHTMTDTYIDIIIDS